jgi:rifampicin phosphotransferase
MTNIMLEDKKRGKRSDIGNKAFNLAVLEELGLYVPKWAVLPHTYLKLPTFSINLLNLMGNLENLLPSPEGWAIRSSSILEDGINKTYAGKYKTLFISESSELLPAVKEVLNSRVENEEMAVIIQEFIKADYSGVAFSCNPVSGEDDIIIEMGAGSGENIVGGLINPMRYRNGYWEGEIPNIKRNLIDEIKEVITNLKLHFNGDVDVEFCIKDNILYWLQVRPVVKSEKSTEIADRSQLDGNWFLLDQCTEPVSPLIQELDPAGFFESDLWQTVFLNNYPYIQMKSFNKPNHNKKEQIDIMEDWHSIRNQYEPRFDQYLKENLDGFDFNELWENLKSRIEVYRNFTKRYMDRNWMLIRRTTSKKLSEMIKLALGDNVNVNVELAKLTTNLNTLTSNKVSLFNKLVSHIEDQYSEISLMELVNVPKISDDLKKFLNQFGYEMPHPVAIHLPMLKEEPEKVLNKARNLRSKSHRPGYVDEDWLFYAEQIKKHLSIDKAKEFDTLLATFRDCLIRTENDDYLLQKGAATIRVNLLEIGENLVSLKKLEQREDVFYLKSDEIFALIAGEEIKTEIELRKAQFEKTRKIMPEQFAGNDSDRSIKSKNQIQDLKGTGVSAGIAEGEVFVIKNPLDRNSYYNIPKNSIVVAPVLTPNLSYQLIAASAIITEVGGFLSHGAIFAREVGIPAVVAVPSALEVLRDGDWVRVNANEGSIERK